MKHFYRIVNEVQICILNSYYSAEVNVQLIRIQFVSVICHILKLAL